MLRPILFVAFLFIVALYMRQPDNISTSPQDENRKIRTSFARALGKPSGRTIAVGDLHSDLSQALAVLRMAKLVDETDNWVGGTDTLVQTGDIVDRGPDTIALYKLFEKLAKQAKEVGGKVVNVYGNHEVMNIGEDLRYVTPEDTASFGGAEARKAAWDVHTGWLGQFIFNNFNITHIQGGHTVFSHGDMHPEWARLGSDTLNFMARDAIDTGKVRTAAIFQSTGPIWNRALAQQDGGVAATCKAVEAVKKSLGVNRLISGHTPQYRTGKILSLCNGGYLVIDVGISSYYGGHLAALEIQEQADGSQTVNALYPGGKRLLAVG